MENLYRQPVVSMVSIGEVCGVTFQGVSDITKHFLPSIFSRKLLAKDAIACSLKLDVSHFSVNRCDRKEGQQFHNKQ